MVVEVGPEIEQLVLRSAVVQNNVWSKYSERMVPISLSTNPGWVEGKRHTP
jgi:hypothetical protein